MPQWVAAMVFHQRRAPKHKGNNASRFTPYFFLFSSVEVLDILSKGALNFTYAVSKQGTALQLTGFQPFRGDRHTDLSGKAKVGGIDFYQPLVQRCDSGPAALLS